MGVGAAGGVLAYELSKAGLAVVGIEVGPFWNPQTDFAIDELHSNSLTRMGDDPTKSVVNGFCQSHDIPNFFICDASIFVASGGANPTETVMAIAARTADYLARRMVNP